MPLAEIAFKLVNQVLKIKPGAVVSIISEIPNADPRDIPLAAIPFIEEIALAIRRKKAFPVIELSTENLKQRFFSEMPDEVYSLPLDYYSNWVQRIDCFIDMGWRTNPELYDRLTLKQYHKIEEATARIWQAISSNNKKIVSLGFPTQALARYFNIRQDDLEKQYYSGLNCDYYQLDLAAERLTEKIQSLTVLEIESPKFFSCKAKAQTEHAVFTGSTKQRLNTVLPAGKLEISLDAASCRGEFTGRVYWRKRIWHDVSVEFDNGRVRAVASEADQVDMYKLTDALLRTEPELTLVFGLNPGITEYCGYHTFDECCLGSVGLKFADKNGGDVLLISDNVLINGDKGFIG